MFQKVICKTAAENDRVLAEQQHRYHLQFYTVTNQEQWPWLKGCMSCSAVWRRCRQAYIYLHRRSPLPKPSSEISAADYLPACKLQQQSIARWCKTLSASSSAASWLVVNEHESRNFAGCSFWGLSSSLGPSLARVSNLKFEMNSSDLR